jgi:hypothetical protein
MMSAAEYRALNAPKTPRNTPRINAAPTSKGKTHPKEETPGTAKEMPAFEPSPAGPRTHLVGPYALAVGGRLHAEQLPDRLRIVITGPASETLTAALVAALTHFTTKP